MIVMKRATLIGAMICFLLCGVGVGAFSSLPVATVQAQADWATTARYEITFSATWSPDTHPHPDFPSADHWSNLVGMMHNESVHLWQLGDLATPGMKLVAERGINGTLNDEVDVYISMGHADQWIQKSVTPFGGVATATVQITTSSDFPLLSLATMVAPSPDWFAGVDSLSLLDANGVWRDSFSIDVYPYDAGTDSGTLYSSSDEETVPFRPIASYRDVAPFSAEPLGTLTVTLLERPDTMPYSLYLPIVVQE